MADAPARDLLAELFDQFDPDEQARIRAAEDAATEILLQGSAAVRDRLLAAGSPNLNDWSQEPENDAQADAATAVYVAYINGLWRQTDTGRPECIEEFLTKIEKLGNPILGKYGGEGLGLVDDLLRQCRTNINLLQRIPATESSGSTERVETEESRPDRVPDDVVTFVKRHGLLQFSNPWRMGQRRDKDLQAAYARLRGKNGYEVARQEELLQDARAWARAEIKPTASEVRDVFELKERVVKKTWDEFVPKHRYHRDFFKLGYLEFAAALWEEGWPSLEDVAIEALAERATSAPQTQSSSECRIEAGAPGIEGAANVYESLNVTDCQPALNQEGIVKLSPGPEYPKYMRHETIAPVIVSSAGEQAALGPEWSEVNASHYPAWLRHWTKKETLVQNAALDAALGGGWAGSSAVFELYRGPRPRERICRTQLNGWMNGR